MSEKGYTKSRRSSPGKRTRQDNGPAVLAVDPVPPPLPREIGPAHQYAADILAGGARAQIAAEHEAKRLSAKFGEPIDPSLCLATPWLHDLISVNRERARWTLMWRPRFLAVLSLTRSTIFASRAARIAYNTVKAHRADDPDFDAQVIAAQERAVELLHDVTMMRAIEGISEPVYWQGIQVGHVRKHDNRLAIEMLRAHIPKTFKTPGYGGNVAVNVNGGAGGLMQTNIVVDDATRDELVALRREALAQIAAGESDSLAVPLVGPGPEKQAQGHEV